MMNGGGMTWGLGPPGPDRIIVLLLAIVQRDREGKGL
jgi:hypothetical protein